MWKITNETTGLDREFATRESAMDFIHNCKPTETITLSYLPGYCLLRYYGEEYYEEFTTDIVSALHSVAIYLGDKDCTRVQVIAADTGEIIVDYLRP